MRALLLKDFYALKESKIVLLIMVGFAVIMAVMGSTENTGFVISYVSIIAAALVLNALAYDEVDNGYRFLFTMPVSRREYVREKYCFALITGLGGWVLAAVLTAAIGLIGNRQMDWGAWKLMSGSALAILLILQAVFIPMQLKFGTQKGKLVMILSFALVAGIGGALGSWIEMGSAVKILQGMNIFFGVLLIAVIVLLTISISYNRSVRIMERKEF